MQSTFQMKAIQGFRAQFCADAEPLIAAHWPQALRQLSLVNVRINAAPAFEACQVDIDSVASYMGRGQSKLTSLFGLLFRRSSCQHPLLAAALGELLSNNGRLVLMIPLQKVHDRVKTELAASQNTCSSLVG